MVSALRASGDDIKLVVTQQGGFARTEEEIDEGMLEPTTDCESP